MKSILSALVLSFVSTAAFAWPAVGDSATYDGVVQSGTQSESGVVSLQTTAIDKTSDQMIVAMTTVFAGKTDTSSETVKFSDMQEVAKLMPMIIANCAQQGGVAEKVTTPAGTFDTCKITSDDGSSTETDWFADVVFGWVKKDIKDDQSGKTTELTLKAFSTGK